ncbi:MAG: 4Fe-4S dicluster domain-containing protein, partial [Verrucomicrobia bacterium]|nr:4Fe-4S dicluster domain-containing protein [Verrucomicrobiota bacterium]
MNPEQKTVNLEPLVGYDSHHPPSGELIDQCVHCGFCLPVCPTYVLWNEEMDSPRGRIYLMKMAAEGVASINSTWVNHFDACLGCMACMTACPSGVEYGKLIEATRMQIERRYQRSSAEKHFRSFLFNVFTRPDRLRALLWPLRLYQNTGLQSLVRRAGIPKLLPPRWRAMESLLPRVPAQEKLPELIPAQGARRHRVGLLLGCVQRVFFPQVNAATARLLAAEGCDVVIPAEQSCCGALLVHAGEEEQALHLARQTILAFEKAEVDTIIINAAGCGSNVKEYGYLLRDDAGYAGRAKAFAEKCRDIAEFLAELEPRVSFHPLRRRVAYHDACHLQHAQRIRVQPRTLLGRIPQ